MVLTVMAVSYTHLRAHETVLDLVCRLLLENNKTLKPNHLTPALYARLPPVYAKQLRLTIHPYT